MQTIQQGVRGFTLLMNLNWDRLFFVGAIALALGLASMLSATLG